MARRRPRRTKTTGFHQAHRQHFQNPLSPIDLLSEDELQSIHEASLDVLEQHGIDFALAEARNLLADAGAETTPGENRVRFPRELVMDLVALAPESFVLHARNPENSLTLGGRSISFSTVSSPPNVLNADGTRHAGRFEDFSNFLKLAQVVNVAQSVSGHPVEPQDVPTPVRHLHATRAMLTLTDKPFRLYSLSRQRVLDVLHMTQIGLGLDDVTFRETPCVFASINSNSPRLYDDAMLWGMIECSLAGQAVFITPFTLAGAMAPVSLAGALTLQNAEALAGIAFTQLVRAGTPVVYGSFTSNVDMKSGAPAFGTPEHVKAHLISGQLARRYRVPFRTSNANAANLPDAQAVYESQMALWSSLLSGSNYVYHGLGWLEGGLASSFEKFMIDAEMIQALMAAFSPLDLSPDELAVDAIAEVTPGAHFLDSPHTMTRYENAFYAPLLSEWTNYEAWQERGAVDTVGRATRAWQQALDDYVQPPVEPSVVSALDEFVARRESEGGAPVQ